MALSTFNQPLVQIRCQGGHVEEVVLSRLENVTRWRCRRCGGSINLGAEPYATLLREQREIAAASGAGR